MKNKIFLLRIAFWLGAVTDLLAAKIMLFPQIRQAVFGSRDFVESIAFKYALGLAASLMLGWTALLIWGSLKPMERRGILLLTIFPVLTGIVLAQSFAINNGFYNVSDVKAIWIYLLFLSAFFVFAIWRSKMK